MILRVFTDLLVSTLQLRKIPENLSEETVDEGCATSQPLKWCPSNPNDVDRIEQHATKGDGKKAGKDRYRIGGRI